MTDLHIVMGELASMVDDSIQFYWEIRMDYFERGVQVLNPGVVTFPLSCTTGEGLDAWVEWLIQNVKV